MAIQTYLGSPLCSEDLVKDTDNVTIHKASQTKISGSVKGVRLVQSPQRGEAGGGTTPSPPIKAGVGVQGLTTLLDTLEVMRPSMDQFAVNINQKQRNQRAKGIIKTEDCEAIMEYWVIFDDIAMKVLRDGQTMCTERHVKLSGLCEEIMSGNDDTIKYRLVDPNSTFFSKCENFATIGLETVLPEVRFDNPINWWRGGYDSHDKDSDQYGHRGGSRGARHRHSKHYSNSGGKFCGRHNVKH
jgi:hypothetical protein